MTDYATPASPGEAMRRFAQHLEYRIQAHEAKVRDHQFAIAELREQWGEALNEAERYEKWQPTAPVPDGVLTDGTPVHKDSYRRGVHDGQRPKFCTCDFDPSYSGGLCDVCGCPEAPSDSDESCAHESRSGVDQTPLRDPSKLWRCDSCGEDGP